VKLFFVCASALLFIASGVASARGGGSHGSSHASSSAAHVQGHVTKNGTYVAPHYRSAPDGNKFNNWSTQGNLNPYTGNEGTHSPYAASSSESLRHSYSGVSYSATSRGAVSAPKLATKPVSGIRGGASQGCEFKPVMTDEEIARCR